MKVYTTPIPKDRLPTIPERERTFLIGIGHIANEVNVFQKLFYWASCSTDNHELLKKAHTTQAIAIAKVLAGKLSEAWIFIEKAFFASSLSKDWEARLQDDASAALDHMKKYFGHQNLVVNIRNNFAFHYSVDDISSGFALPPVEEGWLIVLSESNANSLYYAAELVANYALLESIRPGNHQAAIEAMIDEIIHVARWLVEFAGGCWIIGMETYLCPQDQKMPITEYSIEDAPSIAAVNLPFFVETAKKPLQPIAGRSGSSAR